MIICSLFLGCIVWEDLSVELENGRDISIAYKAVVKAYITNCDSSFEVQNESVGPYDRYKRMDSYFSEIVQKYNVRKQGFFENIPIEIDDDSLSAA